MLSAGNFIHLLCLPYADLVLLSATSPVAILANIVMSSWLFGERFMWRYDLPGIFLIILGTLLTVYLANAKQGKYDGERLIELCVAPKAICCYVFVLISVQQIYWLNGYFSKLLRTFEKDAEKHDQRLR